eukprot:366329-Chlamydomonas_euryale.AAC.9
MPPPTPNSPATTPAMLDSSGNTVSRRLVQRIASRGGGAPTRRRSAALNIRWTRIASVVATHVTALDATAAQYSSDPHATALLAEPLAATHPVRATSASSFASGTCAHSDAATCANAAISRACRSPAVDASLHSGVSRTSSSSPAVVSHSASASAPDSTLVPSSPIVIGSLVGVQKCGGVSRSVELHASSLACRWPGRSLGERSSEPSVSCAAGPSVCGCRRHGCRAPACVGPGSLPAPRSGWCRRDDASCFARDSSSYMRIALNNKL